MATSMMTLCERCAQRTPPGLNNPTASDLEEEIAQIDALMQRLAQRRTVLRRRINTLAPIARLPRELLLEVFSLVCLPPTPATVEEDEMAFPPPSPQPLAILPFHSPLFLGSISGAWRKLAWNTPLLWRTVTINASLARQSVQRQILADWLQRAKSVPLRIKLSTSEEDDDAFLAIRGCLEILLARSAFWETFDCFLPPHCHGGILASRHFPMLTSTRLRPPKGTIPTFNRTPDMFLGAPSLTDVDLSGYDFSSMVLPWHQLRRFRAQFLTVTQCVAVLERCPNLVYCHFDQVYCTEGATLASILAGSTSPPTTNTTASPHRAIVHETLEVLEVAFVKTNAARCLFDGVSTPSLKELAIHFLVKEPPSRYSPIITDLAQLSARIQKFTLAQFNIQEVDLASLVSTLPALQALVLWEKTGRSSNPFQRVVFPRAPCVAPR